MGVSEIYILISFSFYFPNVSHYLSLAKTESTDKIKSILILMSQSSQPSFLEYETEQDVER